MKASEREALLKKAQPLERDIQAKILQYLRAKDIFHYKAIVSSKLGIPDIICCIDGRFVTLEVKRSERHKPTPMQIRVNQEIKQAGGDSYIVWSLDMVKEIIESYIQ
jgi:hypothetical protein